MVSPAKPIALWTLSVLLAVSLGVSCAPEVADLELGPGTAETSSEQRALELLVAQIYKDVKERTAGHPLESLAQLALDQLDSGLLITQKALPGFNAQVRWAIDSLELREFTLAEALPVRYFNDPVYMEATLIHEAQHMHDALTVDPGPCRILEEHTESRAEWVELQYLSLAGVDLGRWGDGIMENMVQGTLTWSDGRPIPGCEGPAGKDWKMYLERLREVDYTLLTQLQETRYFGLDITFNEERPSEELDQLFDKVRELVCGKSCRAPDIASPLATILEEKPFNPEYQDRLRVAFMGGLAGIFGSFGSTVPSMSQHDPCDEEQPPWMGEAFRDIWCAWSRLEVQGGGASAEPSPPVLTPEGQRRYEAFCVRHPGVDLSSLIN